MDKPEILKEFSCPKCNSTDRVTTDLIKKAHEAGIDCKDEMAIESVPMQFAKPDSKPGDHLIAAVSLFDICMVCGTKYIYRIEWVVDTFVFRNQTPPPIIRAPGNFDPRRRN